MFSKWCKYLSLSLFAALSLSAHNVHAQGVVDGVIGTSANTPHVQAEDENTAYTENEHTHPAIKLTPDKSELIRLDTAASSIIIGNPNHLSILADTSKTLVLVPRAVGATHFTVLDFDGNILMKRHVIVGSPKENYLRIRRSCVGSTGNDCQSTSVFYCPDMCHEIISAGQGEGGDAGDLAAEAQATASTPPTTPPSAPDSE